jgi:hypothetical protein
VQCAQTEAAPARPASGVQLPGKMSYFEKVRMRNASAAAGYIAAKIEVPLPPPRATRGPAVAAPAAGPSSAVDDLMDRLERLEREQESGEAAALARLSGGAPDGPLDVQSACGHMSLTSGMRLPDNVVSPMKPL